MSGSNFWPGPQPGPGSGNPKTNGHAVWINLLQQTARSRGRPPETKATYSNLEIILANDPVLADLFGFNEFLLQPVVKRSPPSHSTLADLPGPFPRPWTDDDVSAMHSYVERTYADKFRAPGPVERAMLRVSGGARFHPVRDWLNSIVWDGTARLDSWLLHVFGVPLTRYSMAAASKILMGAVRRVRQPGCKFDHVLVLKGPQDWAKSLAVQTLASTEWFSDSLPLDFASKDAMIGLSGHWIIELAEVQHFERNNPKLSKAFITRQTDIYRSPYGRQEMAHPRQCIMIGTTNDEHFLKDDTGNRRYWPIVCQNKADIDWLLANRTQLWAEAAHLEPSTALWIDPTRMPEAHAEALAAQEERLELHDDPWLPLIIDHLNGTRTDRYDSMGQVIPQKACDHITVGAILADVLKVPDWQQNSGHKRRAARILRSIGWSQRLGKSAADPYGRDVRYWYR